MLKDDYRLCEVSSTNQNLDRQINNLEEISSE